MKYAKKKLRPLLKTFGGKSYLARWIISHFPESTTYIEGYCGGASVLLNKPRATQEIICDTNPYLINLYRVLQDPTLYILLQATLQDITYNESVFALARTLQGCNGHLDEYGMPDLGKALVYLIQARFSVDGLGEDFSWSERLRGGRPGDLNAWETFKLLLGEIQTRLSGVNVFCEDALTVLPAYAGPDTVYYLDPPYPHGTRTAKRAYGEHEMSDQQHADLLQLLITLPAKGIFISTYPNDLYTQILGGAGWDQTARNMANHSARGKTKQRRQEVLWFRI